MRSKKMLSKVRGLLYSIRGVLFWRWYYRLVALLADYSIETCASCNALIFNKDSICEQHTTGAKVHLCRACHQKIFNPFEKAGKS